jgi:lysophospholipase L1-like esterase
MTPIQQAGTGSLDYYEPRYSAIRGMAAAFGFTVIDATLESGIDWQFEFPGGAGRDLYDGLHPNESGQRKIAELVARVVMENPL